MAKTVQNNEVLKTLAEQGCDPIKLLAMAATGDVVGLGLMSQDDLEEEAMFDIDGDVDTASGIDRALYLLPMKTRMDAAKELARYMHAQKRPEEAPPERLPGGTVFLLPDNGRSKLKPPAIIEAEVERIE